MNPSNSTPRVSGYRFPAEWEPQSAVWFAWPTRIDLWEGVLSRVLDQLASLYVLAAKYEPVCVLCPAYAQADLMERMSRAGETVSITLYDYECDDVWCRDYGPLFLLSEDGQRLAISDWAYNAWGNKFPLQKKDNAASAWIAEQLALPRFAIPEILEGGAIESNGAGAALTTEVVLLNANRHGPGSKEAMEALLVDGLNLSQILWLDDGLVGDDTDGHIDNLARFFKEDGILIASVAEGDANFPNLNENLKRAKAFRTLTGKPYELVELPLPAPVYDTDGERLAASYMNFLVLNGAVLVPTYGQPENDAQALEILRQCYPNREIVGFDCSDILHEGGAIHCMSQHQPAVQK